MEARLFWKDGLSLWVRDGREIVVHCERKIEESVIRLVILGPGFATLLQQRGQIALHASAVADHEGAIAFLGASGSGKSTLAAAMRPLGYSVLTDNILPVRMSDGSPMVTASFPKLKLRSDTASIFGFNFKKLPSIEPGSNKCYVDLKSEFAR
jgi:ABC-type proline/glycine betaine transport system ATPase subunit